MRIKDKFIKQKQLTDRPQANLKNNGSTPLLARLEKQYLFNHPQKTAREQYMQTSRGGEKQNMGNMLNSVPVSNQYSSHNVIKIDNYEGKRFKTQHGYQPQMIKSRYVGGNSQTEPIYQNSSVYKTSQNVVLRKDKPRKVQQKIYESVDLTEQQRPLTFGLVRKTEPMKSSVQYQQDIRMKNQILNQISTLRQSQQTLIASKDYSASGLADLPRCANHNNKKAKYRLMSQSQGKQEQQMIYCSKCAINLLQQGFKVEQIKHTQQLSRKQSKNQYQFMTHSHMLNSKGTSSRIQQMRNFQHKLAQVENKINLSLQQSALKTGQIEQIQRQIWQTQSIYQQMIEQLNNMKKSQITDLQQLKKKKLVHIQKHQKQMNQQLQNIKQMQKQMKQFRNKFIIMKENQFQFLMSSFFNKIQTFGNVYQEGQVISYKVQDQIDHILQDLSQFCKQIKLLDQSRSQSSRLAHNGRQPNSTQDDFVCKQIKGPFRTLFPQQENLASEKKQSIKSTYTQQNDSPSFSRNQKNQCAQPVPVMLKSLRNYDAYRH